MKLFNIQWLYSCPRRCLFLFSITLYVRYVKGAMRGSVRDSVSFGFVGRLSILATRQVCKLQSRVYFWTRSFNFFPLSFPVLLLNGEKKFVKGTQCSGNNPALIFACISKEMFYFIELTFHIRYSVLISYLNYYFHTNVKYIAANKLSVE